ncbi:Protein UXT -like protein [Toxocara canis]|uniref:Protein UXT-like protein n=1 Tax=Toxocara canis TaxID=6265 RepID=A0A0B2VXW8_TOXCA|nr:Protein UXT -like protein [Toxocara canis]
MNRSPDECEKYRRFVSERLEVDLADVMKRLNAIVEEIRDYEVLQLAISKIKAAGVKESLETQVNIGRDIFCEAVIAKSDRVIVKLCADIFAELTLDRAEVFIEQRIKLLNLRACLLEKEAHSIRARIHLVLSSLEQLTALH